MCEGADMGCRAGGPIEGEDFDGGARARVVDGVEGRGLRVEFDAEGVEVVCAGPRGEVETGEGVGGGVVVDPDAA